jgi:cell division protease FtsH
LQALRDNKDAIEQMTSELLEIEVITGERVREIIKEHGGTVFEGEDLHSDSLDKSDLKEDIKTKKSDIEKNEVKEENKKEED